MAKEFVKVPELEPGFTMDKYTERYLEEIGPEENLKNYKPNMEKMTGKVDYGR